MNLLNKKPIVPISIDYFEQNDPEQRILLGILCINGQEINVEGSLNEYKNRIQWEIDDLGNITINSTGIITHADVILDESELEKLIIWSKTSYNYLLTGQST
jgi:hypothetical protein